MSNGPPPLHLIFVGGVCHIEPDVRLDTRLPIPGDYGDNLIRAAASSSVQWWQVATGFAQTLLEQASHDDAWICACGPGSLRVPKGGRTAKPRFPSVFPGQSVKLDTSDFRKTPTAPWTYVRSSGLITFVQVPCPITAWKRCPPTAVIISAHVGVALRELVELVSLWPSAAMILLDCPTVVSVTNSLRSWSREGRKPLSRPWNPTPKQKDELERLTSARAKFGNQRPVVVDAEFGITRVAIGYDDIPAERVAAATSFLRSRYDLSIDIWDIVRDPGLATLVAKEEADHIVVPGDHLDRVPTEFMARANDLRQARLAVEAELANFALGEWHLVNEGRLTWSLADPELSVEWNLRVDSNSLNLGASATDGRLLPLEIMARPGWHHGLGWKVGIRHEGHPRLREFVETHLDKARLLLKAHHGAD